jgi:hypothetical protein
MTPTKSDDLDYVDQGAVIAGWVAGLLFLGVWGYCAYSYGFLFGFGLGWLPALIVSYIAWNITLIFWPLVLLVMVIASILLIWAFWPIIGPFIQRN